jgi:hypothetical protein
LGVSLDEAKNTMKSIRRMKELEFAAHVVIVRKNLVDDAAELKLTPNDVSTMEGKVDAYLDAADRLRLAKLELAAAAAEARVARAEATQILGTIRQRTTANPTIKESALIATGIGPRRKSGPPPLVTAPTHVQATILSSGRVRLRWKRNGNPHWSVFIVEERQGARGPWNTVHFTPRCAFVSETAPTKLPVYYRIRTSRNRKGTLTRSEPTPTLTVGGS